MMLPLPPTILPWIQAQWKNSLIPTLSDYIRIPNKSPAFDPQWQQNGYMQQAANLLANWCEQQAIAGLKMQIHQMDNRTPVLLLEIPAQGDNQQTVLLYGHMDKQPEMSGWREGLSPWQPVLENDRLYGRGAGDDGYAIFAAVTAIKALQQQQLPHARCVILIEACEESGSYDLPFYVEKLQTQIGNPDLVICLDSGSGNYEQLWCTTSLRGVIKGILKVDILTEGVHSGYASGVVPSSFRILRQLLNRIENVENGAILLDALQVSIPEQRQQEAQQVATTLGDKIWQTLPFVKNAQPATRHLYELVLDRTWRAKLAVTGMGDMPTLENAGNVLRPATSAMLSLRLPPTCDVQQAAQALKNILEKEPPYQAKVSFTLLTTSTGWNAPDTQPWLTQAIEQASQQYFGKSACYWGEGGSIPFMGMLGEKFPQAQFVITGVLGPQSNAHGPNEFLLIPYAEKITACVASILYQHAMRK